MLVMLIAALVTAEPGSQIPKNSNIRHFERYIAVGAPVKDILRQTFAVTLSDIEDMLPPADLNSDPVRTVDVSAPGSYLYDEKSIYLPEMPLDIPEYPDEVYTAIADSPVPTDPAPGLSLSYPKLAKKGVPAPAAPGLSETAPPVEPTAPAPAPAPSRRSSAPAAVPAAPAAPETPVVPEPPGLDDASLPGGGITVTLALGEPCDEPLESDEPCDEPSEGGEPGEEASESDEPPAPAGPTPGVPTPFETLSLPSNTVQVFSVNTGDDQIEVTGEIIYTQVSLVFENVNRERRAMGLNDLVYDPSMQTGANLRAAEASVSWSHTRPDGSICTTVTSGAHGENLAYGQRDADSVVAAWMRSEGHRSSLLHERFTRIAISCVNIDGVLYWVQLFGR